MLSYTFIKREETNVCNKYVNIMLVFFVSFYEDLTENFEQLKEQKDLKMEQQSSSIISSEVETNIER